MGQDIVSLTSSGDVLFMMLGAVMVFAMHGGFAFLEVGTVRKKNQVNALVKILADFSISTIAYFLIGQFLGAMGCVWSWGFFLISYWYNRSYCR